MPFGLMNAGATFQHAMGIAFIGERDKFVVIYLDDITVFSKSDKENCCQLRKVSPAFINPKGILAYMNVPQEVVKVLFSLTSCRTKI